MLYMISFKGNTVVRVCVDFLAWGSWQEGSVIVLDFVQTLQA